MAQRSCTTRWALMVISRLTSISLISLTGIARLLVQGPWCEIAMMDFSASNLALFWQLETSCDMLLNMGNLKDAESHTIWGRLVSVHQALRFGNLQHCVLFCGETCGRLAAAFCTSG